MGCPLRYYDAVMKAGPRKRETTESATHVRLQRAMADAGIAARRSCEKLIEEGHVRVNGETVTQLPIFINPEADRVEVEGRLMQRPERKLYLMVYKPPRMLVTSADEPELDRATIMEIVDHPAGARLYPVGRLDFETGGLVLMTNDGDLSNALTHPRFRVPRVYEAVIKGTLDQAALDAVRVKIRGQRKRAAREDGVEGPAGVGAVPEFELVMVQAGNTIVRVTLVEAQNRELRDTLAYLGMPVKKLTRVALGGLELSGVAAAQWRELTRDEVQLLRRPRGGYMERRTESQTKLRARHRSSIGTRGPTPDGRPERKVFERQRPDRPGREEGDHSAIERPRRERAERDVSPAPREPRRGPTPPPSDRGGGTRSKLPRSEAGLGGEQSRDGREGRAGRPSIRRPTERIPSSKGGRDREAFAPPRASGDGARSTRPLNATRAREKPPRDNPRTGPRGDRTSGVVGGRSGRGGLKGGGGATEGTGRGGFKDFGAARRPSAARGTKAGGPDSGGRRGPAPRRGRGTGGRPSGDS